jgi:hypothetical protein
LLLDSLCVLQFLNELHLDEFHLHDFLFLYRNEPLFLFNLSLNVGARVEDLLLARFLRLLASNLLFESDALLPLVGHALLVLLVALFARHVRGKS